MNNPIGILYWDMLKVTESDKNSVTIQLPFKLVVGHNDISKTELISRIMKSVVEKLREKIQDKVLNYNVKYVNVNPTTHTLTITFCVNDSVTFIPIDKGIVFLKGYFKSVELKRFFHPKGD